jgi:hypothetical protein
VVPRGAATCRDRGHGACYDSPVLRAVVAPSLVAVVVAVSGAVAVGTGRSAPDRPPRPSTEPAPPDDDGSPSGPAAEVPAVVPAVVGSHDAATALRPAAADAATARAGTGGVVGYGAAPALGPDPPFPTTSPLVALAPTPSGDGYWVVGADGGVFSYGDARYHGSTGGLALRSPVVGVAATPSGRGYWLVAADGGVFAFGDAAFLGSTGGLALRSPVVALLPTPTSRGYRLVAADGGVFAFGDAAFLGAGPSPAAAVVGAAVTTSGDGYWLFGADGAVSAFGDAPSHGTLADLGRGGRVVAGAARPDGRGYWQLLGLRSFTIVAGGDVLLHSQLQREGRRLAGGAGYDFGPLFAPIAPIVAGADLALCHLETPLSADDGALSSYPVFNVPNELADALAGAGFDGCSTASNHSLDRGAPGIDATLAHLDRVGLGHAGTARSPEEAVAVRTYRAGGATVAHLSYTYGFNGFRTPAGEPWRANLIDTQHILADAAAARAAGADLVVVSLHWGVEYTVAPTSAQRDLAPVLLASPDVDVILGHHAHVVQPVERIGDEYVVYGMGNLLSGQVRERTRDGVVVTLHVAERPTGGFIVESVDVTPTWVEPGSYRIVPAEGAAGLGASCARTVEAITSLGAPGVTATLAC